MGGRDGAAAPSPGPIAFSPIPCRADLGGPVFPASLGEWREFLRGAFTPIPAIPAFAPIEPAQFIVLFQETVDAGALACKVLCGSPGNIAGLPGILGVSLFQGAAYRIFGAAERATPGTTITGQDGLFMNPQLLSCEKLQIPEALTLDHEVLRAELKRAAMEPGRIGKAAKRVEQLCLTHFAKEEENVFRAFGLLHDLASDRMWPNTAAVAPMIARFSAQHLALRDHHRSIQTAVEELLQEARKEKIKEIAELAYNLKDHEKIENQVMYPTMLMIDGSVRESLGT